MRELIGRLEVVDDDAASALRVIAHFDGLIDDRASGPAMLRAAAALAGCPAAWHDSEAGTTRRVDASGRTLGSAPWHTGWPRVRLGTGRDGAVWLERTDAVGPLDQLILERLGKALDTAAGPRVDASRLAHAVRAACDPDLTPAERRPALEVLALTEPVTVWAVEGASPRAMARRQASIEAMTVLLIGPVDPVPETGTARAGTATSAAEDLPQGLVQARTALRLNGFATSGQRVVRYEELGAVAALAEGVSPEWARGVPDVAALDRLLPHHPWLSDTVAAVVANGSMRQAAATLHLHHSTLQERLVWLAGQLGYDPLSGTGRERLALALSLWRVAHAAD